MGCGSSSLKGEKVDDIKADQPQPVKKVRTNFSEVDFTGESGNNRRGTVAVAPDEQRRPTRVSEVSNHEPGLTSAPIIEEPAKEAYNPIEGETSLDGPSNNPPVLNLPPSDPTSDASKTEFASSNAPVNNQSPDITNLATPEDKPRRRSWLARFSESRKDKSLEMSDEELKKHIGMTRAEFEEWKKDPKNKVGQYQPADDGTFIGGALVSAQ